MISNNSNSLLQKGDVLLVVDLQNDFCPGGALPVPEGDRIIHVVNDWIKSAVSKVPPVYFSRDFHPLYHPSFKTQGGPWPEHCIQDTDGAKFHPDLYIPEQSVLVTKGVRFDKDQNSAFDDTGLDHHMRQKGVNRIFVCGLALDVCVLATVLDGIQSGFQAVLLQDCTRPVKEEEGEKANQKMREAGAIFIQNGRVI